MVEFDEGVVRVKVFGDFGDFEDEIGDFVEGVFLFAEHVVGVICQEVAYFVVALVANQLESI